MTRMQLFAGVFLATILSVPFSNPAAAQQATITGIVTDVETGTPVADAAIQVLGQQATSAATSPSGEFRVCVRADTHSIVVTRIGYETALQPGGAGSGGGELFPLDQGPHGSSRTGPHGLQVHRGGLQGADFQPNARLELTVYNALNNLHREFVGAPELGRLGLVRVKYDF